MPVLSGTVVDGDTQQAVQDVPVAVREADGALVATGKTDAAGRDGGASMSRTHLWTCLVGWLVGCTSPTVEQGSSTVPAQAEAPIRGAVATTEANKSTLVVSDLADIVAVRPDIQPGTHTVTDLPRDAAVSRITSGNKLVIETVQGVREGHALWKIWDEPVGTVEVAIPPIQLPEHAVEWVLVPGGLERRLGTTRQLSVLQDNLDANGTLDLFLRVTQNGVPIATGFSTDLPLLPSEPSKGGLPTARAEISGWRETPTLVDLRYINTTTHDETVELDVDGFRGSSWVGWGSRHAADSFEVEPLDVASVVDALDPAFHDGFLARAKRVQSGTNEGDYAEVRVRHAVPAPGDRETFALTSADIPRTFESIRWDPLARQLHLDWTGVACKEVGYVLLQTIWSLQQSETGRTIEWTIVSPASDLVQLPRLPPETDDEVLRAMVDPSFALTISVEALAVEATYAHAAGLDGRMTPADVGNYSCLIGYAVSLR